FQFAPPDPAIAKAPVFAETELATADYDSGTQTMTIQVPVINTGQTPMDLQQFTTGTGAGPGVMNVSPSPTVEPGTSTSPTTLTLTMKDPAWEAEHLVPIGESQLLISGVLVFETADGQVNLAELEANLKPRFD
ncbi:MAG TPA: methane monooxygenase/ammonia monooxygenase subunit B, partial [Actinomycetes bacterium]|nr:methane monooxygenase/ammonia monooxygenase subunit B [Actinomycetes bacterium]